MLTRLQVIAVRGELEPADASKQPLGTSAATRSAGRWPHESVRYRANLKEY